MAIPHSEQHPIDVEIDRLVREPNYSALLSRDMAVAIIAQGFRRFMRLPMELQKRVGNCIVGVAAMDDVQAERVAGIFDTYGATHSTRVETRLNEGYRAVVEGFQSADPPIDLDDPTERAIYQTFTTDARIQGLAEAAVGVIMAGQEGVDEFARTQTAHYAGSAAVIIRPDVYPQSV